MYFNKLKIVFEQHFRSQNERLVFGRIACNPHSDTFILHLSSTKMCTKVYEKQKAICFKRIHPMVQCFSNYDKFFYCHFDSENWQT